MGCFLMYGYSQAQRVSETIPVKSGQYFPISKYLNPESNLQKNKQSDEQITFRYSSPWFTYFPGGTKSYWLGSTTTQSFNNGKFGTVYYYDQLGNFRYANTFIDITGKNKRGIKLMLPTVGSYITYPGR